MQCAECIELGLRSYVYEESHKVERYWDADGVERHSESGSYHCSRGHEFWTSESAVFTEDVGQYTGSTPVANQHFFDGEPEIPRSKRWRGMFASRQGS